MRVLLDSCVSSILVDPLVAAGHEVEWVGNWRDGDPGDARILDAATVQGRVLVTLDRDFGELAVLRGIRHCGIVRLVDIRLGEQATRCIEVLAAHGPALLSGAIVTAEPLRTRVRPAD